VLRPWLVLLPISLVAAGSCGNEPTAPAAVVNGIWCTSGYSNLWPLTLTLAQQGDSVYGSGTYRFLTLYNTSAPWIGAVAVSGTSARSHISLSLQYESYGTAQYTAVLVDAMHMAGPETMAGWTDNLTLARGKCGLVP
jgi:hypothetical protein